MRFWIRLLPLLFLTNSEYCKTEKQLDIIGGNSSRLVTEGSQVTITCCMKEQSSGFHQDQLIWYGPQNEKIHNYFEDFQRSANIFSLVDYSKEDRLVNQIIIENFAKNNEGTYTCSYEKLGQKFTNHVYIKLRPNIIIGSDLSSSSGKNSSSTLTAVTRHKMIERERRDEISCKVDENYFSQAEIKWFFNGKPLDNVGQGWSYIPTKVLGVNLDSTRQTIEFPHAEFKHQGVYLCKVEIPNPLPWNGEDETFSNHGYIVGKTLVQYQPFDVTIFSRPVIFPGSPRNIQPELKTELYENILSASQQTNFGPEDIVTSEGVDMTLECASGGYPSPTIYWYRGANLNSLLQFSKHYTKTDTSAIDSKLWEMIENHGFNSSIVQQYLGSPIAEGDRLTHENDIYHEVSDHNSTIGFGDKNSPIQGLRSEKGRFVVFAGKKTKEDGQKLTVSQLTIKQVRPIDATIYTCIAVLNMTDSKKTHISISSLFPKVIFKPEFIPETTNLNFTEYPERTVKMTCEVFGGLFGPNGLKVFFVRGPAIELAHKYGQLETYLKDYYLNKRSDGRIEFIDNNTDQTYQLTIQPRQKNPYVSIAELVIKNLKPDDNAYYACFAMTAPYLVTAYPSDRMGLERLTVLFRPNILRSQKVSPEIVYATMTDPAVLSCRANGQPEPEWIWSLPNGSSDQDYKKTEYRDGEMTVSNLTMPNTYLFKNTFGIYSCKAKNSLGEDEKQLHLKLAYHPGHPKLTDCAKNSVRKIVCIEPPKDNGGFPVMYYDVRMKFKENGPYFKMSDIRADEKYIDFSYEKSENYNYLSVSISAVSKGGKGMSANIDLDKSMIPREAPLIQLVDGEIPTQTTYKLKWQLMNPRNTVVNNYLVNCQEKHVYYNNDHRSIVAETNPEDHIYSYQLLDLIPGRQYICQIHAETEPSHFPASDPIEFQFTTPTATNLITYTSRKFMHQTPSTGAMTGAGDRPVGKASQLFHAMFFLLLLAVS